MPDPASLLRSSLSSTLGAARTQVAAAGAERAKLAKVVAAKDLRKAADADPELKAALGRVTSSLAAEERRLAQWQQAMTQAVKEWQAVLAEMAQGNK